MGLTSDGRWDGRFDDAELTLQARISDLEAEAAADEAERASDLRQWEIAKARIAELEAENARLLDAITTADRQIGDGHIGNARDTLHAAMDAT